MSEIDNMARELLGVEYQKGHAANRNCNFCTETWDVAIAATRVALLTAPPGWKLVPVEPTPEMWEAAGQIGVPYPSHSDYYRALVAAAPEPK